MILKTLIVLSLLNQPLLSLKAKSPTDIGKIHSITPITYLIDPSKSLSRTNQYFIHKADPRGIMPMTEDFKAQGLIILCNSPYNTISPVRKPNS